MGSVAMPWRGWSPKLQDDWEKGGVWEKRNGDAERKRKSGQLAESGRGTAREVQRFEVAVKK